MSARVKNMLSTILQRAELKPFEKEAFEGMWDAYHRYSGRLSSKQQAWIEKVFFAQKLDRSDTPRPAAKPAQKRTRSGTFLGVQASAKARIAYINHPSVSQTVMVTNLAMLQALCPEIRPQTPQHQKIKAFFQNGGEVLKIKPHESKVA